MFGAPRKDKRRDGAKLTDSDAVPVEAAVTGTLPPVKNPLRDERKCKKDRRIKSGSPGEKTVFQGVSPEGAFTCVNGPLRVLCREKRHSTGLIL